MRLIIGLGNPGRTYKYSRHNIGFLLIDRLRKSWRVKLKRDAKARSYLGKGSIEGKEVILARPLCFMNLSGQVVNLLLKKYDLNPEYMLVVFDDLDLEWGKIRIRPGGSSGGHKGVESIIKTLHSSNFARLRIGIGRPRLAKTLCESGQRKKVIDYVLSSWTRKEKDQLSENLERAVDCCKSWVIWGINKTMSELKEEIR